MIYLKGIQIYYFYTIIFILIIIYLIIKHYNKKNKTFYFRDIPKIPSAVMSYYINGKIDDRTIWLTILDLINKNYYKIEKIKNKYYLRWQKNKLFEFDSYDLTESEKLLVKFINFIIYEKKDVSIDVLDDYMKTDLNFNKKINRFYSQFRHEIKENYGILRKENNYFLAFLLVLVYTIIIFNVVNITSLIVSMFYSVFVILICLVLKNINFSIKGIVNIVILFFLLLLLLIPIIPTFIMNKLLLFVLFNPLLFINVILILKMNFYTTKQKEICKQIDGLKNFLEYFSNIDKKSLEYINLFDRYYAVAVALDVKLENPHNVLDYEDESLDTLNSMEFAEIIFSHIIK